MEPTNQDESVGLWDRIKAWLRGKPETNQEDSQNVDEGINMAVPIARGAILKKRQQMREIDDLLRDN